MAISPKPKKQPNSESKKTDIAEAEINSLIEKGGSVAKTVTTNNIKNSTKKITPITLRIQNDIVERIAQVLASRPIKTPRHTWILEAILEKLEREENSE